jgi:uncharacterized protein YgiM (DUF1202 family)
MMVGYQFTGDVFRLPGVTDAYGRNDLLDVRLFTEEFLTSVSIPILSPELPAPVIIPAPFIPVAPHVTVTPILGQYVVTASASSIRTGPSVNYAIAGAALPLNTVVHVTETSMGWAHLTTGAWCSTVYLVKQPVITEVSVIGKYTVTASALNIRTGPGTTYSYAGAALLKGTVVSVTEIVNGWAHLVSGAYASTLYLKAV